MAFATLVFGGVMERHPGLKVCLAHGGGHTCFGIGRIDRGWRVRPEARIRVLRPPSAYLRSFYYDTIIHDDRALQFIVDTVGADRVLLGTDWPAGMGLDAPVELVNGMAKLSEDEKRMILGENAASLLGL
jgi:aminocarboxymuconate-semialdehyde decarboxylase